MIEAEDQPFSDLNGVCPGHPAEAAIQFVGGVGPHGLQIFLHFAACPVVPRCRPGRRFHFRQAPGDGSVEFRPGRDVEHLAALPARWRGLLPVGADPVFEQGALPPVIQDCGIKQPEAAPGIHVERRVAVWIPRSVGQHEALPPGSGTGRETGGFDANIVRLAFPGAVEPAGQEVAVGGFHNAGTVVVPGFDREDPLRVMLRFRRRDGGRPQ